MQYRALADTYDALGATQSTEEKTARLAKALADADDEHLPMLATLLRGSAFADWESAELGVSSALARDAIARATGVDAETVEDWWREAGDLGSAAERAVREGPQRTLVSGQLTVRDVHETLRELPTYEGEGSEARRVDAVAGLLADAEPREARYVVRTILGALRLGVGEGLLRDAVAEAFLDGSQDAVDAVERAHQVTNDIRVVAERARGGGRDGLSALDVEPFRPIKPMLARSADGLGDALAELGDGDPVLLEAKYDGLRIKAHGDGEEVRLFTRRLEDVTAQFPEVRDAVASAVDADAFIAESEVVAYDDGEPLPFQELSRRIKREHGVEEMVEAVPVTAHVFDLLYLDGETLLDAPLRDRLARLDERFTATPGEVERAAHVRTADRETAEAFYADCLAAGHEGVMAKNLDAAYHPGTRVGYQLKVKATMEPLDLVVTRAKYSEGRKRGYLGRPYLACRDADGEFREVGRMHTGFTDEQLERFHGLLEPHIRSVDGREADLRPRVVLEVEFEEIQESPTYDSGYALRFPRLSAIRDDLDPSDVDTLETVERRYAEQ